MHMTVIRRRLSTTTRVFASVASLYLAGCAAVYNNAAGITPQPVQILWNTNGPPQTITVPTPAPSPTNPNPAPPVQPPPTVFGTMLSSTPLGADELNAVADTPGTFVYTPSEGSFLTAGLQTLSVTFTPSDTTHYAVTTDTVQINVLDSTSASGQAYLVPQAVQIVGGGYVDNVLFHPLQQGLEYAKTDVGGAYRWVPEGTPGHGTTRATCPSYVDGSGAPTFPKGGSGEPLECGYWVPLLDFVSPANPGNGAGDQGVESIGLDPSDPMRLYLATGLNYNNTPPPGEQDHFYLSDDQGNTFTQVNAPFPINGNDNGRDAGERFGVDPNLGTTIFYGSRKNGLWKSLDRGMTWAQVATFPVTGPTAGAGVVFITFDAKSGKPGAATPVIYAGVSDYNYYSSTGANSGVPTYSPIYQSVDAGLTWQAIVGQPTSVTNPGGGASPTTYNLTPIHSAFGADGVSNSDGSLYVTYFSDQGPGDTPPGAGAVYKYTPLVGNLAGVGTWTNISPTSVRSSQDDGGYSGLTLDPEMPGTLMVSTMDDYNNGDGIYRSLDYGNTWRIVIQGPRGGLNDATNSPWVEFGSQNLLVPTGNWPSGLAIDPFNSSHAAYGTGQTLWDTQNLLSTDINQQTIFSVGAYATAPSGIQQVVGGSSIEETVILGLSAPPTGAPLLSALGDLGAFSHTLLNQSPLQGAAFGPQFTTGSSIDFAQDKALTLVRVGTGVAGTGAANYASTAPSYYTPTGGGAPVLCTASTPSGTTCTQVKIPLLLATSVTQGATVFSWVGFPTLFDAPTLASVTPSTKISAGGGTVAIAPDASTILWAPYDFPPSCSADSGNTFTPATGGVVGAQVVSDRVTPGVYYQYDSQSGKLLKGTATVTSLSTGQFVCNVAFTTQTTLPAYSQGQLTASFGGTGQLMLAIHNSSTSSANGVYTSSDGGATLTQVGAFTQAYAVGVGAAATSGAGTTYSSPAIYVVGFGASGYGFYRSIDNGTTFAMVSNPNHLLGTVSQIVGDPIHFGRFYLGTGGRGIAVVDSE